MTCKFCGHECKKDGHQANGTQRYECKHCHRKQQEEYTYNAYSPELDEKIVLYTKEGTGIRSTARILQISATTLLKRIIHIGKRISHPPIVKHRIYEVDEIKSFIKRKQNHIWIAYALDRKSKEVVSFNIGARTNSTLSVVTETLHIAEAKRIYTDRLRNYKSLIDHSIHRTSLYGTNHIERHNLTLRTHLKRLSRKTICFSRSMAVLTAILKIYFWG
uniref:IS1 family transposase n=1 Tax=Alistipes sp. D31t1_170403_E11 TaxID=2787128 RepID=UPI00189B4DD1|nr:IS1 family transposase [Alistipes sp. D31t1_170403_E11]